MSSGPRRRFFFISSNWGWGGSEELWSAAATILAGEGHDVTALTRDVIATGRQLEQLREHGCRILGQLRLPAPLLKRYPLMMLLARLLAFAQQHIRFYVRLRWGARPDLIVLSQGGNFDGYSLVGAFLSLRIPYVVICQKATDLQWPTDAKRERLCALYDGALASCFVSEHNRRLTEQQLGASLAGARVVRNPFLVSWEPRTDWPDDRDGIRLACVGRLSTTEKGQDLLLRVMAREKWRNRPMAVTFYGEGSNRQGLIKMAESLGLTKVSFAGFVDDVASVWTHHHGLILPSRSEGLPLAIVEAMLSGRVSIVTDVGGNREVVEDGSTGFIAKAPTEDALDDAMERAWQRRHEWRTLGAAASARIRTLVPSQPASIMAAMLDDFAERGPTLSSSDDVNPAASLASHR